MLFRVVGARAGALALALLLLVSSFEARALQGTKSSEATHVYLLTGLLGITSGLDGVTAKIKQHGIATSMSSPGGWGDLTQSAIQAYKAGRLRSIIIIGYSTGGRSALEMSSALNAAKVPVQLVVLIDSMSGPDVTPNVRRLVNFRVDGGYGAVMARPKHFAGSFQDIAAKDPAVGHFTIIDAYERQLLNLVLSARVRGNAAPATNGSVSGAPAPASSSSSKRPKTLTTQARGVVAR